MTQEQREYQEYVNRFVGILIGLDGYVHEGVFNHEGVSEMAALGRDLAEVAEELAVRVQKRLSVPEWWLNTDYAPWRGERFEETPQ